MGPPLITIGSGPHLIACGNCEDLIATLWKDPMQKLPHLEPTTRYIYIYILGGGFKYFYFHPDPWGNDPI